jgi:hypothetical protein
VCAENSIVAIRSTTIYNNTTNNQGGGISLNAGSASLQNTIVAGNSAVGTSDDIFVSGGGVLSTLGHNLIGSNEGVVAVFPAGNPNVNNDIVGTVGSPVDPMLDVLNTYIGPNHIPTHVPLSSSPVIDKGNSFGLTTDQRGYMRPIDYPGVSNAPGGDGADIGAVEQLAPSAAGVAVGGRVLTAEGKPIAGALVTLTDASGSSVTSISSSFGFYQFESVPAGAGYWVRVRSKRFSFPSQFIVVDDNVTDLDIIANW